MRAPEGMTISRGRRVGDHYEVEVGFDREWLAARLGLLRLLMGVPPC